ncbi:MAG: hypothetical protein ACM3RX_05190 [Methanococcaceae archaeon]
MENSVNESKSAETAEKKTTGGPVQNDGADSEGKAGNGNNNNNPNGNEANQADQEGARKKPRSSTRRKLASDKNILRKKLKRRDNLEDRRDRLRAIRSRGYEERVTKEGKVIHVKLTPEEKFWYGVKIDNLEEEIINLDKEISDLRENFGRRVKSTKKASKERVVLMRQERRAKSKAKKLLKENEEKIVAAARNGEAETFKAAVMKYKEENKKDDAFESLSEFFERGMTPLHRELQKDPMLKEEFLTSTIKLLSVELKGQD